MLLLLFLAPSQGNNVPQQRMATTVDPPWASSMGCSSQQQPQTQNRRCYVQMEPNQSSRHVYDVGQYHHQQQPQQHQESAQPNKYFKPGDVQTRPQPVYIPNVVNLRRKVAPAPKQESIPLTRQMSFGLSDPFEDLMLISSSQESNNEQNAVHHQTSDAEYQFPYHQPGPPPPLPHQHFLYRQVPVSAAAQHQYVYSDRQDNPTTFYPPGNSQNFVYYRTQNPSVPCTIVSNDPTIQVHPRVS